MWFNYDADGIEEALPLGLVKERKEKKKMEEKKSKKRKAPRIKKTSKKAKTGSNQQMSLEEMIIARQKSRMGDTISGLEENTPICNILKCRNSCIPYNVWL